MNRWPVSFAVAWPSGLGHFTGRRYLPRGSRGPLLGGVRLRCLCWLRTTSLDKLLAAGADPIGSNALSLRAGQLGSAKTRARLIGAIEAVVELAERQPGPPAWPKPLVRRAEVRAWRAQLVDLAERLRDDGPLSVQGLAMTSMLVGDGASPLYYDRASSSLGEAASSAVIALEPPHLTGGPSATESPRGPTPRA